VNEILRRAILSAHLDEVDVAARLDVDPKTVRRWLEGRLPQTRHRWALADLLKLNATDLWPELRTRPSRPGELLAVYPHRTSVQCEAWRNLFSSAEHEISILDYSSLFLAEDADIIRIFAEKARTGVRVRIALSDPDWPPVTECSAQEVTANTLATEIRNALISYQALRHVDGIEIRFHQGVLYNSIYRADSELFVSQSVYGIPISEGPTLHLHHYSLNDLAATYLNSFDNLWGGSRSMRMVK
jgi:hypothetical protein